MIGAILGEFWPFIAAGIGALIGVLGFQKAGAEKKKRKDAEDRIDTLEEVKEHEREAMQLDDTSLADRLTRP